MTMGLNTAALTLDEARKGFDAVGVNIARSKIPHASRIDSVSSTIMAPTGELLGFNRSFVRQEDQMLSRAVRSSYTEASKIETISQYLHSLGEFVATTGEGGQSRLIESVDKFIAKSSALNGRADNQAMKENFVHEAQNLAKTISDIVGKVDNLRFQADQDLSQKLKEANKVIKELFSLNQSIQKSAQKGIHLHDDRDRLLNELSTYLDIRVSLGHNGSALITSNNGGAVILDQTTYGQFDYPGIFSQAAMVQNKKIAPVTMHYIAANGSVSGSIEVIGRPNSKMTPQIYGGKIAGLVELRDQILLDSKDAVSALAKVVVENVNRIHNNGSPFPPQTKFKSAQLVGISDSTWWSGKIDIAVVNRNGSPISTYKNGAFKPVTIDLENLPGTGHNGQPTIKDLINEINELLYKGPAGQRLALGKIDLTINDQYLLNDIKMVARSNIADNNFIFDFELDGSQYFGSQVQILAVSQDPKVKNVQLPTDQLPGLFSLKKGAHVRTNQPIIIGNVAAGQDIEVKFRVIGDNGVVEDGTAIFTVPANPTINERIVGRVDNSAPRDNKINTPGITHSSLARAKLVDFNGIELNLDDPAARGHLLIEVNNGDNGLVIIDGNSKDLGSLAADPTARGFSHYFGFNNFFVNDETHGTVSVRDDILTDVNKLSTGHIRLATSANACNVKTGSRSATATLNFEHPALASMDSSNINVNDQITINNETFEIVTAGVPAAQGNIAVPIGGDLQHSLKNLVAKINNSRSISSIIKAEVTGSTINLTAKVPGSSGNNIEVRRNLAGPFRDATKLQGGVDSDTELKAEGPMIGNNSQEVLQEFASLRDKILDIKGSATITETSTSLSGYALLVSSIIGNQIASAKSSKQIATGILQGLNKELQDKTAISKEDEHIKLMEWSQLYSAGIAYNRMMQKVMDDFFRLFY